MPGRKGAQYGRVSSHVCFLSWKQRSHCQGTKGSRSYVGRTCVTVSGRPEGPSELAFLPCALSPRQPGGFTIEISNNSTMVMTGMRIQTGTQAIERALAVH